MSPFRRSFPVINIHELSPNRFVQGRRSHVRVGKLMCLGTGSEPHLGNVEVERLAGGCEEGFDERRLVGGEEAVLVERGDAGVGSIVERGWSRVRRRVRGWHGHGLQGGGRRWRLRTGSGRPVRCCIIICIAIARGGEQCSHLGLVG